MITNKDKEKYSVTDGPKSLSLVFTRLPVVLPGRIALGAAIIGGICSLGGNLTLLFLAGAPSISSFIILICWVVSVMLLFFRMRWGLLLSSLLGGIMVIAFLTTPYVIEHLSNPNSADGGLGVFAGDLLVISCGFGLISGSLAASWQHYKLLASGRIEVSGE